MKYRHRLIEDMVLELILPALIGLARIRGALAGDVLGEIDGRRSFCRRMVAFQLEIGTDGHTSGARHHRRAARANEWPGTMPTLSTSSSVIRRSAHPSAC